MKPMGWWLVGMVVVFLVEPLSALNTRKERPEAMNGTNHFRMVPKIYDLSMPIHALRTTLSSNGVHHLPYITWVLKKEGGNSVHVDLNLTKFNWNDNFLIHMTNEREYRPSLEEMLQHHCTYRGSIREHPELTAAVTTCGGLRGQLSLGKGKVLNIRPLKILPFNAQKPLLTVHTTFYLDGRKFTGEKTRKNIVSIVDDVLVVPNSPLPLRNARPKRRAESRLRRRRWYGEVAREKDSRLLVGHGTNDQTRYVEVLVVADHAIYKKFGDFWTLVERIKKIIQVANALMREANFFLVFTGLEVWDRENEVPIPDIQAFEILVFKNHTEKLTLKHKFDLAVYLVGTTFSNLYGQSFSGRMCSSSYAYILVADVSQYYTFAASTLAHGLAHTLNVTHDNLHCRCPDQPSPCIMSEVNDITNVRSKWSDCSLLSLSKYISSGGGYCLRDRPTATLFGPTCGDGLIEKDEECDCGLVEYGSCSFSPCCDPMTCKLKEHAVCATGGCCNATSCQYYSKGEICRKPKSAFCDIMESCTGDSALCPEDVYVNDGFHCLAAGKKAYCYKGACENHLSQCMKLYGSEARVADAMCYTYQNLEGQPGGSCGSNSLDQYYPPCEAENVWCGTLHCDHPRLSPSQRPQFMGGMHTLWTNYNNRTAKDKMFRCKWVVYEVGDDYRDPGLVHDGVQCAKDSMCIDSKCVRLEELKFPKCPLCYNGGRCTNHGTCDCGIKYLPPFCKHPVPNYGFREAKFNAVRSNRNLTLGSIAGVLLVLALMFIVGLVTRKMVHSRNIANQFEFRRNVPAPKMQQKARSNKGNHNNNCNSEATKNNSKLSPFSSPQQARKGLTKIPSVRIYDISSPFLQSSTNNHLTELTAKDSSSTTDSNSTTDEQTHAFTPTTKALLNLSMKPSPTKEIIYANGIMAPSMNGILNMKTRLLSNHHDSKDELLQDKSSTDQSNGEEERPASPKFRYENVDEVKVQKEEAQKSQKVVYANSFTLQTNRNPTSTTTQPAQDPVFIPVKYDNVDDLISVRCPLYQAGNKVSPDAPNATSNRPESGLYATPIGKNKGIHHLKRIDKRK